MMSPEAKQLEKSMELFFKHAVKMEDKGEDEKAERFLSKAIEKEAALLKLGQG